MTEWHSTTVLLCMLLWEIKNGNSRVDDAYLFDSVSVCLSCFPASFPATWPSEDPLPLRGNRHITTNLVEQRRRSTGCYKVFVKLGSLRGLPWREMKSSAEAPMHKLVCLVLISVCLLPHLDARKVLPKKLHVRGQEYLLDKNCDTAICHAVVSEIPIRTTSGQCANHRLLVSKVPRNESSSAVLFFSAYLTCKNG